MASTALLTAALLTVAVSIVHSWIGERRLIGPLLAIEPRTGVLKSAFLRQVLRHAWHITSLAWTGMAVVLAALAVAPQGEAGRIAIIGIGVTFLLHGVAILALSRGRHIAWPAFLAIGALCLFAAH